MIETFFLDWGLSFGAGLLFGLAGRREIAASPPGFRTRAFRVGFAYQQAGVVGIAIALWALRPDWMWMYWVPDAPLALVALAFALYEIAFVAGFAIAPSVERARRGAGVGLAIGAGIALAAAQVAARTRLWRFGTFEEFHAGRAAAATDGWEVWFLGVALTASTLALVALLWRVARERNGMVGSC